MSSETCSDDQGPDEATEQPARLRASDYLWRPWYAKMWWAAIPLYWAPAGGPTRIAWLADFYESGYAVVTNIVFLPVTALFILGLRYFGRFLEEGEPVDPPLDIGYGTRRGWGMPHPTMDEFDPRSGPRWIGNHGHDELPR
ncbi:hypothetical protein S2M10_36810 [Sphingomonas sp. S2M10]|jgi:hypothetical protein|uniref:hypothetical protein n=1 Tax=Sphingomonadales TaxID=204457 RepID=UPI001457871A|nr:MULTISPECIES: hypothetical protein [Sphingomonadaceae]NLS28670.1 hypothetical protein [Sphingomonas sp. S2M10]